MQPLVPRTSSSFLIEVHPPSLDDGIIHLLECAGGATRALDWTGAND